MLIRTAVIATLLVISLSSFAQGQGVGPRGNAAGGVNTINILEGYADESSGQLMLIADEFVSPAVTFGSDSTPLTIVSNDGTTLVLELPHGLTPGNYRIEIEDGNASGTFDFTLGAVGPQGPEGPQGEPALLNEMCELYRLIRLPPPEMLTEHSDEFSCDDGIDNDCNGFIDEQDAACQPLCEPIGTEPNDSHLIAIDLGDLLDQGSIVEISGNVSPSGDDVDWFRFRAVDTNEGRYGVSVSFLENPSSSYRFSIYRNNFSNPVFVSPPAFIDLFFPHSFYESEFDDTAEYFVKVETTNGSAVCGSYLLEISNGYF